MPPTCAGTSAATGATKSPPTAQLVEIAQPGVGDQVGEAIGGSCRQGLSQSAVEPPGEARRIWTGEAIHEQAEHDRVAVAGPQGPSFVASPLDAAREV